MAGPWFTVQESGAGWRILDTITISDGNTSLGARVELRLELEEPSDGT